MGRKPAKKGGVKPPSKSEVLNAIAEETGLKRKEVSAVMQSLQDQIGKNLGKKGGWVFVLSGMIKLFVKHKPATKARKGKHPITGVEMTFKAKPARNIIKVRPLKALKDMVN